MLKQIINQETSDKPDTKSDSAPSATNDSTPSSSPSSAAKSSGGKNILSSDVEIKGTLRFAKDLIIDGRITGEVNSDGDLTVGENAQIEGDINTRSVTVFGKVNGNITVSDRCELKQSAELSGDVAAGKLAIEEGASFMGSSTVGKVSAPPKQTSQPSSNAPKQENASQGSAEKGGSAPASA